MEDILYVFPERDLARGERRDFMFPGRKGNDFSGGGEGSWEGEDSADYGTCTARACRVRKKDERWVLFRIEISNPHSFHVRTLFIAGLIYLR